MSEGVQRYQFLALPESFPSDTHHYQNNDEGLDFTGGILSATTIGVSAGLILAFSSWLGTSLSWPSMSLSGPYKVA